MCDLCTHVWAALVSILLKATLYKSLFLVLSFIIIIELRRRNVGMVKIKSQEVPSHFHSIKRLFTQYLGITLPSGTICHRIQSCRHAFTLSMYLLVSVANTQLQKARVNDSEGLKKMCRSIMYSFILILRALQRARNFFEFFSNR